MRITERMIKKYHGKEQEKVIFERDHELRGFAFKVSKKGLVSFFVEARIRGKGGSAKRITIGKYPAYSAEQAKESAKEKLRLMYEGIDPKKQQQRQLNQEEERDRYTLEMILGEFITRRELKDNTKSDYKKIIHQVYPDWLHKPVVEISRQMVEDRFFEHKKSVAALSSRVLSSLMNYAKAIELSNGERLLTNNSVDVLKDKKINRVLKRKQTVISPRELSQILGRLHGTLVHDERTRFNISALEAIYVVCLTGCRKTEILTLKKRDVHSDYFVITDTKNKREHVVPITDAIRWIIQNAKADKNNSPWLFPSNRDKKQPINNPMKAVKAYLGDYTLHDCRRTFITVANELGIDFHSIKELVNHKSSSDVTDGYIVQRIEQKLPRLKELYESIQREMLDGKHLPTAEELFVVN